MKPFWQDLKKCGRPYQIRTFVYFERSSIWVGREGFTLACSPPFQSSRPFPIDSQYQEAGLFANFNWNRYFMSFVELNVFMLIATPWVQSCVKKYVIGGFWGHFLLEHVAKFVSMLQKKKSGLKSQPTWFAYLYHAFLLSVFQFLIDLTFE